MNNIVHVYVVNVPNLKIRKLVISFFFYNLFHRKNGKIHIVDTTRSTGLRNSLLNEKKMWVDFRVLENPSLRRNGFALESPLTFYYYYFFKWRK